MLGKRELSYRHTESEAVYTPDDDTIDLLDKDMCIRNATDGASNIPLQRIFSTDDLSVTHSFPCLVLCTCT